MGNILSAIYDDMEDYEFLCRKYGEAMQYSKDAYGNDLPDCYGKHATTLKNRQQKDREEERKCKK